MNAKKAKKERREMRRQIKNFLDTTATKNIDRHRRWSSAIIKILLILAIAEAIVICVMVTSASAEMTGQFKIGSDVSYRDLSFVGATLGYKLHAGKITILPYGSWLTWYESSGIIRNYPFRDIYSAGVSVSRGMFTIRGEHWCNHVVYSGQREDDPNCWYSPHWGGSLTTISIEIDF